MFELPREKPDRISPPGRDGAHVPVTIAGPDLAATTVEPHEFLDFLVGKFERRFITTLPDTLEDALVSIDDAPDADGRYRVNKLYCRDNTWQQTFARLLVDSDAVLMDVRAFSRERRGCEYELRHLSLSADPRQVVLLVDESTDRNFLLETLGAADAGEAELPRIVHYADHDRSSFDSLIAELSAAMTHAGRESRKGRSTWKLDQQATG